MNKAELSATQLRAIRCILECSSIDEAAKRAKISRATLYIWMKQDSFKEKLQVERDALFYESLDLLKQSTGRAVKELVKLLESRDEKTRRLAAKEIINTSLKITEIKELEERVSELEELFEQNKSGIQKRQGYY